MLKTLLLLFCFFSFNNLFSSENDSNSSIQQKQLYYFVIRFEADCEQQEGEINELLKINCYDETQRENINLEKYICFALGDYKILQRKNINPNDDFIEDNLNILFYWTYKKYLEKFKIDLNDFIANKDIFIPISAHYDCFEILLKYVDDRMYPEQPYKVMVIKPGKKYIIKFDNFSFDLNGTDIHVDIQDIQENQLKVKNVLNEVLENVPIDINKLISQYLV